MPPDGPGNTFKLSRVLILVVFDPKKMKIAKNPGEIAIFHSKMGPVLGRKYTFDAQNRSIFESFLGWRNTFLRKKFPKPKKS